MRETKTQISKLAVETVELVGERGAVWESGGQLAELSTVFPYDRDPVPLAALVHKSTGQKGPK